MPHSPTLAEALAVRPEQLTGLTPVEIDRYNAVLWAEFSRVSDAIDKAIDGLYRALLLSKESVRRGRGYSRVWPISLKEAEERATEHLETSYEPDQMTRVQSGLHGDRAYAKQLRKAVDHLAALRAEYKALEDGPEAVLMGEFERRGRWSRMFLCLSDGGHIHQGRQCPSIGPRTELRWLPEVSGMEWREAFRALRKDLAAGSPAIMCTKCYPDAPTEWTVKAADPKECPGSRQYAKLMAPDMMRRVHRWAECHECGKEDVGVTPNGNLRKHNRPEGGKESKPEAPAPKAPATPAPKDDNRLVVIERTLLQAAEEAPAPAEEAPKGKPGGTPTVTAVIKLLKDAGFQHSRYTDAMSQPTGSGFYVSTHGQGVSVRYRDGDHDFFQRMSAGGYTDVVQVPDDPKGPERAAEYAEVLASRYTVELRGNTVHVGVRAELPARPKGVPTAPTVRRALIAAGLSAHAEARARYTVLGLPEYTRVAVFDEDHLRAVAEALTAEGWLFTQEEKAQHFAIKITGSAPDRPARLRKLRAERAAKAQQERADGAADQDERAPVGSYVAWAEGPQERTEFGHVVGQRGDEALVMGLDGGLRQMSADVPEQEPEPLSAPTPYAYDSKGRRWQQGHRAEFKTVDGFLFAGEIIGFGEEEGQKTAMIRVDTRRAAPASRSMYKGDPNRPGKPRPLDPPQDWTRPLDKLNKPL